MDARTYQRGARTGCAGVACHRGLRYTNFHSTALCSPTRAALITGRNHHSTGFGVISEQATGYPGYNSILTQDKATIGKVLKDNGYRTSWFGKNHNTPSFESSQIGPFDRWPTGMGFEYFYGFMGGDTNQWEPANLARNTTYIYPFVGNPGYNLTTAMAEEAIAYMNQVNTLIIYISGDNGSSAEGTLNGTPNEVAMFNGIDVPVEAQLKNFYAIWGTDKTYNHMAVPWSWAFDSPFSWTKQVASHFGGVRQGTAISWPKVITDNGGIRHQFHHVIDIVPTILEAARIRSPKVVDGIPQSPIEGVSMAYTFDKANAKAASRHKTQYFEMMADRALYQDGWIASTKVIRPPWVTFGPANLDPASMEWELYDLNKDWTQSENVAARYPPKLKRLQDQFWVEAKKYNVLPLDASVATRLVVPRPSIAAGRNVFTYAGEFTGTPNGVAPSILNASYNFKAEVEVPQGGAEGMIVTQGGRFGGYGFYVLKGKPVFLWNLVDLQRIRWEGAEALSPGKHTLEFDFKYDGLGIATLAFNNLSGIGRSGTGVLKVDGKEVAGQKMDRTLPLILQWDENFDVGADTGTPVNDADYQVPFRFTGKLNKLTLTIDRPKLTPEDEKRLMAAQRNNKTSE